MPDELVKDATGDVLFEQILPRVGNSCLNKYGVNLYFFHALNFFLYFVHIS